MTHLKIKSALALVVVAGGLLGLANTSASAKNIWIFGKHDRSIQTAPKSIRGTWYGYQDIYDKHPSKLVIHKKGFKVAISGKSKARSLKYAKSWKTAYRQNHPSNIDLRKSQHGWYYFAVNLKPNLDLSDRSFYYGQVLPVKYHKQHALAYVPAVNQKKSRVLILTKKKVNHPLYKSTKGMTVINFYGGK